MICNTLPSSPLHFCAHYLQLSSLACLLRLTASPVLTLLPGLSPGTLHLQVPQGCLPASCRPPLSPHLAQTSLATLLTVTLPIGTSLLTLSPALPFPQSCYRPTHGVFTLFVCFLSLPTVSEFRESREGVCSLCPAWYLHTEEAKSMCSVKNCWMNKSVMEE